MAICGPVDSFLIHIKLHKQNNIELKMSLCVCVWWSLGEDTLSRGDLDIIAGSCGGLHLLSVGELGEQPGLKVLPALVLLPSVDKHLVLGAHRSRL